ncbi:MAG: hypothetical protein LC732_08400 [Acidobacteria bacterium]|nr:hypothetical protein [Acidobacteriota bacterium]
MRGGWKASATVAEDLFLCRGSRARSQRKGKPEASVKASQKPEARSQKKRQRQHPRRVCLFFQLLASGFWLRLFFWLLASGFWLLVSGFAFSSGFWLLASGLPLLSPHPFASILIMA